MLLGFDPITAEDEVCIGRISSEYFIMDMMLCGLLTLDPWEKSQNNDDDENYNVIGGQLLSKRGCG